MEISKEELKELITEVAVAVIGSTAMPGNKFTPGLGADGAVEVTKDAGDQPWYSFGEFLSKVASVEIHGDLDPRLAKIRATGLSEGIPADGGFLVSQEFIATLLEKTWQTGQVASRCFRQPVGAMFNGVKIPAINETSRANGSRWGGVRAYWLSEGGTKTPSQPAFRQISMDLQKLIGLCYVTDEMLQDITSLEGHINRWFPLEIGFKLDDAVINGDGSGKPLGIINSPCVVSIAKESGQGADTVVTENVLKMWNRMWGASRRNAVWWINQDIETQLELMTVSVGTGGVLSRLYDPPGSPTNAGPDGKIKGRPVIAIEQCSTLGDTGDIILADMGQYMLIDKGGIQAASSIHVQFVTDETAYRFVYRINGQPLWNSALTPFKGSATQSPFLKLDARA